MSQSALKIGILALQGAVFEHEARLKEMNVIPVRIKHACDLQNLDGLIIPGGESTVIGKLIVANELQRAIYEFSESGKGILGTCAGMILCAMSDTYSELNGELRLNLIDINVARNGFGRQKDSFEVNIAVDDVGDDIPAVFIRAPFIESVGSDVSVLAMYEDKIVVARQKNILVCAFHPELTSDDRILRYFLAQCCDDE